MISMEAEQIIRTIAGLILVITIITSMLYQFPQILGASHSFTGEEVENSGISTGTIVFMDSGTEYNARPGEAASFIYEDEDTGERTVLTREVMDDRVEDGERELNVRDSQGEGTLWLNHSDVFRTESFSIPVIGHLINFLRTLEGIMLLIFVPASILLYTELMMLWNKLEG